MYAEIKGLTFVRALALDETSYRGAVAKVQSCDVSVCSRKASAYEVKALAALELQLQGPSQKSGGAGDEHFHVRAVRQLSLPIQ